MNVSDIEILSGNHHSVNSDICVVIDVLRASSTQYALFSTGVQRVYLAPTQEEAFLMKGKWPEALLVGEIEGLKIDGFDLGNSPFELAEISSKPEFVIHKTTNGTTALVNSFGSVESYSVGLNGAPTLIRYLRSKLPALNSLTLVASHHSSDEDRAVAEFIKGELGGNRLELESVIKRINQAECADKFKDPGKTEFRSEDLALCGQLVDDNFLMKLKRNQAFAWLEKVPYE